MFCQKCGKELKDGEKICSNCGYGKKRNSKFVNVMRYIFYVIVFVSIVTVGVEVAFDRPITKTLFQSKGNVTMQLKNDKSKQVTIKEKDVRDKANVLMEEIGRHYSGAAINQVNEIKLIYNYKEKTIEYIYLSVNLNRYYTIYNTNGTRFQIASVSASMSKNGTYVDSWKETSNGNNTFIFDINNLPSDCGLIQEDDDNVLVKIKNELNDGRDNTFYWREVAN